MKKAIIISLVIFGCTIGYLYAQSVTPEQIQLLENRITSDENTIKDDQSDIDVTQNELTSHVQDKQNQIDYLSNEIQGANELLQSINIVYNS